MSENRTQTMLNNYCQSINIDNHPQEGNKEIFGSLKPDGYYISSEDCLLIIFECKSRKSQYKEASKQLQKYIEQSSHYIEEHELTPIPIFCYGTNLKSFKMLYIEDFNVFPSKEFQNIYKPVKSTISNEKFNPHIFNQWIYDNFNNISSDERLLIVIGVLLTKYTLPPEQLKPPLFMRVLEVETAYEMDNYFKFIKREPYITCINEMFKYLANVSHDDILNHLYACFVEISIWSFKGSLGDSTRKQLTQTEGAVLTPPDIVKLMIESLNIKSTDSICDPCCGTANFLISGLTKTNQILGNEKDLTRYIIAKHGLIISGIESPAITLGDCMKTEYIPTFDFLLMNPPYGGTLQQDFSIKFIKLARKGGAIIIPISDFQQVKFQNELKKICQLEKLIVCNNKVFYPVNNIQPAILIFSKPETNNYDNSHFELFDFINDGADYIRGNFRERVIVDTTKQPINNKIINDNIWRFSIPFNYNDTNFMNLYYEYLSDVISSDIKNQILINHNLNYNLNIQMNQFKDVKYVIKPFKLIGELFTYIGRGKTKNITTMTESTFEQDHYPLISAKSTNNGIYKYIQTYDYDEGLVSIATNGSVGAMFIQNYKFSACPDVSILKPIISDNVDILRFICFIASNQISNNYNWSLKITKQIMKNEIIYLPTIDNKITIEAIQALIADKQQTLH